MSEEGEFKVLIPQKYLSETDEKVSTYWLMKFVGCVHLASRYFVEPKRALVPAEMSLLHCLYLAGWSKGTFRKAQSVLALDAGTSISTVGRWLKSFEQRGLIQCGHQNKQGTRILLGQTELTYYAKTLFLDDDLQENYSERFRKEAWGKRAGKKEKPDSAVAAREEETPKPTDQELSTGDSNQATPIATEDEPDSQDDTDATDELDRIWEELEVEANQRGKSTPEEVRDEYAIDPVEAEAERDRKKQQMKDRLASAMKKRAEQRRARFDLLDDGEGVSEAS